LIFPELFSKTQQTKKIIDLAAHSQTLILFLPKTIIKMKMIQFFFKWFLVRRRERERERVWHQLHLLTGWREESHWQVGRPASRLSVFEGESFLRRFREKLLLLLLLCFAFFYMHHFFFCLSVYMHISVTRWFNKKKLPNFG
jgi:hypothetical protein